MLEIPIAESEKKSGPAVAAQLCAYQDHRPQCAVERLIC